MEFISKLEELMKAKELLLGRSLAFGKYKKFFPSEAVRHPSKTVVNLLEYLIKNYTNEGDVVLDPMAGTGSTCVLASLFGRNSICVELEKKFVEWELEAKNLVEKSGAAKGKITIIQGDARELTKLLHAVDSVITSPPYSKSLANENPKRPRNYWKTSGGYQGGSGTETYGENPKNIGNLPYNGVDSIITSPPYSEGQFDYKHGIKLENFSPNMKGRKAFIEKWKMEYSKDNITTLKHGDIGAVIASPPYEGSLEGTTRHTRGGIASRDPALAQTGSYATALSFGATIDYSPNKNNIGNMKKETYLEAMFKVYSEMYSVLRPSGKAIIVVKPFIRNKQVVDLPWQTWLLLQKVGFKLTGVLKSRLEKMSFWRVLYYKHFPDVPVLAHEYIIIVEK